MGCEFRFPSISPPHPLFRTTFRTKDESEVNHWEHGNVHVIDNQLPG
jgi:hypothetical protein